MEDYSNKTCLFIGRFQPFSIGQMMVVEGMAKSCKKVVIVIGSSDKKETKDNPFDFEERREMIQRALQWKDLIPTYDISIFSVSDTPDDSAWIEHVRNSVGEFDAIWTGNSAVKKICQSNGVSVKDVKEVPGMSGDVIRELMAKEDERWVDKVPEVVAQYIKSIDGVSRIINLS